MTDEKIQIPTGNLRKNESQSVGQGLYEDSWLRTFKIFSPKAGSMSQALEHLSSKGKALSSNFSIAKKKIRKQINTKKFLLNPFP
jgi:hypothetical protein